MVLGGLADSRGSHPEQISRSCQSSKGVSTDDLSGSGSTRISAPTSPIPYSKSMMALPPTQPEGDLVGQVIQLPRGNEDRPDRDRLALRFEQFRKSVPSNDRLRGAGRAATRHSRCALSVRPAPHPGSRFLRMSLRDFRQTRSKPSF
jgi:hypothetical protein